VTPFAPEDPRRRTAALALGAGLGWTAVELVGGSLLRRFSPYQVVWTRYAVHLLVVVVVAGRSTAVWRSRRPGLQLLSSFCMLAMPVCFVTAARFIPVENAWAGFWVAPLLTLALGALVLGESLSPRAWVASTISFTGALLILAEVRAPSLLGLLATLGMALSFAGYLVLARVLRAESTASKLFYTALGVFLALTPVMPGRFVRPNAFEMTGMAALALFGIVTLGLFDRALEGASLNATAPLVYGVLLWHLVFAAARADWPGRRAAVGGLLIAAAFAWHTFGRNPSPSPSSAEASLRGAS
jgi:drug/metabolite transporter (DMT)-like permease